MGIKEVTGRRLAAAIAASMLVLAVALMAAPLIGPARIDYQRALDGLPPDKEILFQARLPRVLLAALAGGALATTGVLFQALLRDALAEPYTLGVASGASLGAVMAICFGLRQAANLPGVWAAAFLGAAAALLVVMAIAGRGRRLSSFTLLLAGITMNSIAMAVILFLQNLASFAQSFAIVRWLMGGIEAVEYSTLAWLAAVILPVEAFLFARAREWNLMAVGEEWAAARGASPRRLLWSGFVAGSLLVGSVTAITGPIGFLGLIVPHALRLRLGADHRLLLPCSFFFGAAFLVLSDTVARTALSPAEIPVGVITALAGGPFFIWLLSGRRKSLWL